MEIDWRKPPKSFEEQCPRCGFVAIHRLLESEYEGQPLKKYMCGNCYQISYRPPPKKGIVKEVVKHGF